MKIESNRKSKITALVISIAGVTGWLHLEQRITSLSGESKPPQSSIVEPSINGSELDDRKPATKSGIVSPESHGRGTVDRASTTLQRHRSNSDKYAEYEVVDSRISKISNSAELRLRERLVMTDFKYPLVRVVDTITIGALKGDVKIIAQSAMAGGHLIVGRSLGSSTEEFERLIDSLGYRIQRKMNTGEEYLVALSAPDLNSIPQAQKLFQKDSRIEFSEPDYIAYSTELPDDSDFGSLWGLHNTGQAGGTVDADIDAIEAWDLTDRKGSQNIRVAVLDSGIARNHEDLFENIWVNPNEVPGNGIDDDGNGFEDDIHGWDFVNNDNNPSDDNDHGTHVAGTIGAMGNNAQGVAGVCWDISLIGLKFLDQRGYGYTSDAAEAIAYARSLGVDLISNSWGGGDYSRTLAAELSKTDEEGILVIAAAGNERRNNDRKPEYPASYDYPNIIAVAATTQTDGLAGFSSFGPTSVDLGAPGTAILSTIPGDEYASYNGTSMACPHVTGACAYLMALDEPRRSAESIKSTILESVDLIASLEGKSLSGGRLNLHQAVRQSGQLEVTPGVGLQISLSDRGQSKPESSIYRLYNRGFAPIEWTAESTAEWLELPVAGGIVQQGSSYEVSVLLNGDVTQSLPKGVYQAELVIRSVGLNEASRRNVTLFNGDWDYLTEVFDTALQDTDHTSFVFTPDESPSGYAVKVAEATSFPSDPTGGTALLLKDDGFEEIVWEGSEEVILFGKAYDRCFVGSNGYLTFERGDTEFTESLSAHFSTPRISGFFDDLSSLSDRSLISWKQFQDHIAVTYQNLSEHSELSSNNFQIEMFFDGMIRITHLEIDATDGLVGLSQGNGVAPNFVESDLSRYSLDRSLLVQLPNALSEGDGIVSAQASIFVSPPPTEEIRVRLASSDPAALDLPNELLVPAGQGHVSFDLAVLDDDLIDGSQSVTINASSEGHRSASHSLLIHDNETAALSIATPKTVSEDSTTVEGSVNVSIPVDNDVHVRLTSNDSATAYPPPTVVIRRGTTSAPFKWQPSDNDSFNGDRAIRFTAAVVGWKEGYADLTIQDDEHTRLILELPNSIIEGETVDAKVRIAGTLPINLIVSLSTPDLQEISLPSKVEILAGSLVASFPLIVANGLTAEGQTSFKLLVSAKGFEPAAATVAIIEDPNPPSFSLKTAKGHLIPNGSEIAFLSSLNKKQLRIHNSGPGDLEIVDIYISGNHREDFQISTEPSMVIPPRRPSGSSVMHLSFNPTGTFQRDAVLNIIHNDWANSPYTLILKGPGPEPEIDVFKNSTWVKDGSTAIDQRKGTFFGSGPQTVRYKLENSGTSDLHITNVVISGLHPGDFIYKGIFPTVIAPKSVQPFEIDFRPTGQGQRRAHVEIFSNDLDESSYGFMIGGDAGESELSLTWGRSYYVSHNDFTPDKRNGTHFGNDSQIHTFKITNNGLFDLVLGEIRVEGNNPMDFSIIEKPRSIVKYRETATLSIQFRARDFGNRSAIVTIESNSLKIPVWRFGVSGAGVDVPFVSVQTDSGAILDDGGAHEFGPQLAGARSRANFSITNTGLGEVNDIEIRQGLITNDRFRVVLQPKSTLLVDETTPFTIRYNPIDQSFQEARFQIWANGGPVHDFVVTGGGTVERVFTSEVQLSFGRDPSLTESVIQVSELPIQYRLRRIQLAGFSHSFPDDADIYLRTATGSVLALVSDSGGDHPADLIDLTFDLNAVESLPDSEPLESGLFQPTDYEATETLSFTDAGSLVGVREVFTSPPEGIWTLYLQDDSPAEDNGSLLSWSLIFDQPSQMPILPDLTLQLGEVGDDGIPVGLSRKADAAQVGDDFWVEAMVMNQGSGPAAASKASFFLTSKEATRVDNLVAAATVDVPSLAPGERVSIRWEFNIPPLAIHSGVLVPVIQLDADNVVEEAEEENQIRLDMYPIKVGGEEFHQLQIVRVNGANTVLKWRGLPNHGYRLQRSTDLITWSDVTTRILSNGEAYETAEIEVSTFEPKVFFRVSFSNPPNVVH